MIMKMFKPKNNYYKDYSVTAAVFTIYLFTVFIAACVIIPAQEEHNFFIGILKALIWPLYLISLLLG